MEIVAELSSEAPVVRVDTVGREQGVNTLALHRSTIGMEPNNCSIIRVDYRHTGFDAGSSALVFSNTQLPTRTRPAVVLHAS